MSTPAEADEVFARLRRVYSAYRHYARMLGDEAAASGGRSSVLPEGTAIINANRARARRTLLDAGRSVYSSQSISDIEAGVQTDLRFLRSALEKTGFIFGRDIYVRMRTMRSAEIWNRYLNPGEDAVVDAVRSAAGQGNIAQQSAANIIEFGRALAAFLVYRSDSPYPPFQEHGRRWEQTTLGVPPEPPRMALPGGPSELPDNHPAEDANSMDAGVPMGGTGGTTSAPVYPPNQEGGLSLPTQWIPWNSGTNDARRWARADYGNLGDDDLKAAVLARENNGHPS